MGDETSKRVTGENEDAVKQTVIESDNSVTRIDTAENVESSRIESLRKAKGVVKAASPEPTDEHSFHLDIIASNKVFYKGACYSVIIPALDGELEIMAHHEDMVVASREGEVRFQEVSGGEWLKAVVGVGFGHVANNRVTVLVDTAERPEDIDAVRANQARLRAEEQLRQKQSIMEYHISQASLARALSRLKEVGKYQ
jgi:F-type H+-transporting ATPase subunit epsilon